MAFNYYELLELSCQKKLTEAEIVTAIDRRLGAVRTRLSSGTIKEAERAEMKAILDEESNLRIFAKDKAMQKKHADDLKKRRTVQLETVVKVMKQATGESPTIVQARVRRLAAHFDLDMGTAKGVFTSAGFKVETVQFSGTGLFPDDTTMREIEGALIKLKDQLKKQQAAGAMAAQHIPAGIENVETLYDYLAVMHGKGTASAYRAKDSAALAAAFQELAHLHTQNAEPFVTFRTLESAAMANIFKSDTARNCYENAIKRSTLDDMLGAVAALPDAVKADIGFANGIITLIGKVFADEDLAIYVYNKFCRVPPELWIERESNDIRTTCRCGHVNVHSSAQQAQKAKCICGEALYRPCPSCGKMVPNAMDFCFCGYFIPNLHYFEQHVSLCRDALKSENLEAAKSELAAAKQCMPAKANLSDLEKQVAKLEGALAETLAELDGLIAGNQLNKARMQLAKLKAEHPRIDLSAYERKIERKEQSIAAELKWAADAFRQAQAAYSPADKIRKCMEILARVPEYKPALNMLSEPALSPQPVRGVSASIDHLGGSVTIAWEPNPANAYVTYSVVRMAKKPAKTIDEGVLVAEGLTATSFKDAKPKPGVVYWYTVFAVRAAATSVGVNYQRPILIRPPLKSADVSYEIVGGKCILRWKDIYPSVGAQIDRQEVGGNWIRMTDCARPPFEDSMLVLGKTYRYRLYSLWAAEGKNYPSNDEVLIEVRAVKKPNPVDISVTGVTTAGICSLRWLDKGEGELWLYKLKPGQSVKSGDEFEQSLLSAMGVMLNKVSLASGNTAVNIGAGTEETIVPLRPYGSKVVAGKPVEASSMGQTPVDWSRASLSGNTFEITCADLPANIVEMHMFIYEEDDDETLTTDLLIISKRMIRNRDADVIKEVGSGRTVTLKCSGLPQKRLGVSIVGVTKSGATYKTNSKIFSNIPKKTVKYAIDWEMSWFGRDKVKGMNLSVTAPDEYIPHMLLCYRYDCKPIMDGVYVRNDMEVLAEIPAMSGKTHSVHLTAEKLRKVPANTRLRLLIAPDEARRDEYDNPECSTPMKNMLPT